MNEMSDASLLDAEPGSFWLDDPNRPEPRDPLDGDVSCDLAVVGGGYSGLSTALLAKERDPDLDVVLVEGVRIVEQRQVLRIGRSPLCLETTSGTIHPRQVALGTNVFPSLVKRIRLHTVPVYDYVLMTEPLSAAQKASIGWTHRQGIGDSANQFHYYRLSVDDRILWGGYDAIYRFGGPVRDRYDQRPATSRTLARHFFQTFPQLEGLRFSHAWGGPIDTCTRFCAFFGTTHGGDVAYATGFTGLGVGATRFGAQVMLDLLAGEDTERTRLEMVRTKPLPFPPEPFASIGIQATRRSLHRADQNVGRRNLWLRTLDRLGLGFDS